MAAVRHLKFAKLQFRSHDLYRHVILHLCSKFRVYRPIWRRDIVKKTIFNMASVRYLGFVMTSENVGSKSDFVWWVACGV